MTINEEINEYPELSCTYENQNMHIEIPEWEQMCTWSANDNALSQNRVSEQTQVDYIHIMEHGKTITHGK